MKPMIEFKDFSFKYRAQTEPTLHHINLSIMPGEKILIVGPSGSGKSTLAHCINGLVPFSYKGENTGSLLIDGKDPKALGIFGLSQIVGTVLQDTDGQFIGLTVAEDIAFALENELTDQQEMKKRVETVAKEVELLPLLKHAPGELSGGQKQRVSMAGVMVDNVKVLLFDEPLANLDPATGKKTIKMIDEIRRDRNATVIMIEHRLEDALFCDVDRIILINEGRILADMSTDELLSGDYLMTAGIREPLYVTALKHAGCRLTKDDGLSHCSSMNITPYVEKLREWNQEHPSKGVKNDSDVVLQVENVSFAYHEEEPVLQSVSFVLHKGEMVSIVGKNGAGKSTLSNLICGFIKPDAGKIYLDGEDIEPLSIKERGEIIGLVMQSPNQMISKPMIKDEVALGLRVKGIPEAEIEERVKETLITCGLYEMRNWPVSALSYGQKKRVSIASILVMHPKILILDEPTAGQDYRHYTEIMEFLKKINKEQGITIVMITHDMHLMLEYTNRAIVLADGKLLADDLPSRVLTNEEITDAAYLKKTSLYDLAKRCGIEKPYEFVQNFIEYERLLRINN